MAFMENRIRGLDGLRAIAVLMVFTQHRITGPGNEIGHLGVWIFFALSGFLITGILTGQREKIDDETSHFFAELKRFLFRRTLRIFPVYYLLLAVMAALMGLGFASPWLAPGLLFHFAYLSNIWIGDVLHYWPGPYSHLWSLSIEEQFYIFFAPLLLIAPARWHLKFCYVVFAAGVASIMLMRIENEPAIVAYTNPLGNFWLFALGGIGAAWLRREQSVARQILSRPQTFIALVCGVAALAATQPLWKLAASPVVYTGICMLYGVCIAATVCSIACSGSARLVGLLETRWLASLGRISYGFYLYHNFVPNFARLARVKAMFGGQAVPWWVQALGVAASFVVALVLAKLSWRYIEEPVLRLKTRQTVRAVNTATPARRADLYRG
jgi:peptidoglycan/LPS O-acetylase OafA/YrhL